MEVGRVGLPSESFLWKNLYRCSPWINPKTVFVRCMSLLISNVRTTKLGNITPVISLTSVRLPMPSRRVGTEKPLGYATAIAGCILKELNKFALIWMYRIFMEILYVSNLISAKLKPVESRHPRFNVRSISRDASRLLITSRLSAFFLERARPINTFTRLRLVYTFNGTIVNPFWLV